MLELISGMFEITFMLIVGVVAGITAALKGRNGLFWGIVSCIFPATALIVFLLPRKVPKFKSYLKEDPAFKDKNPVIASIMALSAIVAKADGQVTREEVLMIKQFITGNFRISGSELATYQDAFDYGKDHAHEYEEFVRVLKLYHNNRSFALSISYLLLSIGLKDNNLQLEEEKIIKKIVVELGLSEYEYQSIKTYFMNGGFSGARYAGGGFAGNGYNQNAYGNSNGFNQQAYSPNLTEKYTKVLGIDPNASMAEIKKAYRKLAKEYHPDKLASQGMPEDYMKYANERIAEINEAYDYMKKLKEGAEESTQYVS